MKNMIVLAISFGLSIPAISQCKYDKSTEVTPKGTVTRITPQNQKHQTRPLDITFSARIQDGDTLLIMYLQMNSTQMQSGKKTISLQFMDDTFLKFENKEVSFASAGADALTTQMVSTFSCSVILSREELHEIQSKDLQFYWFDSQKNGFADVSRKKIRTAAKCLYLWK